MALIDSCFVESRVIGGVPILGTDAWAPQSGSTRECELYSRFGPEMEEARIMPDTWFPCVQEYTVLERILQFAGISCKPKYLRQAVVLDRKTGKYIFALAEHVELALKGEFRSKFGAVRPTNP